ncbi:MAG: FGGY family carbohydrate kinase [Leadbetterella sp.]
MNHILAIDQGTSSTKALLFDQEGNSLAKGYADLETKYLDSGYVEQDPFGIFYNALNSIEDCIKNFQAEDGIIDSNLVCGISNQRETFMLWDKKGVPVSPAIVWSCKRSISTCDELKADGYEELIKKNTGLIIDPYFSGTKLLHFLEYNPEIKARIKEGDIYFGTVDTWLLFGFSCGKIFKTDYTNAHRTLLFNIHSLAWDKEILKQWDLEGLMLPEVHPSSHDFGVCSVTHIKSLATLGVENLHFRALIGDSHAAAFGEGAFEKGSAKITLGTGSSILMNIGDKPILSNHGLLTTICWSTENEVAYAYEGAIVACGSTVEWVKNTLKLFDDVSQTSYMAEAVKDNGGVYFIPAFSGLGAPHWQLSRKASIEGLTFGSTKEHIVRAMLESIPYQIMDVLEAVKTEIGGELMYLAVNGGLTKNNFVLKSLSSLLNIELRKQSNPDVSALGAAYLAGLSAGFYKDLDQLQELNSKRTESILPQANKEIKYGYTTWKSIISKV